MSYSDVPDTNDYVTVYKSVRGCGWVCGHCSEEGEENPRC